jgi:uncharacterized protein
MNDADARGGGYTGMRRDGDEAGYEPQRRRGRREHRERQKDNEGRFPNTHFAPALRPLHSLRLCGSPRFQERGTSLSTQALIADWVERRTWAVVGASDNRAKFGNRIYRVLRERGYVVYPVNPTMETVEGDEAYPDVGSLPPGVEVLDIVIPPPRVPPVLDQAKAAGITRIWLQPGAESPEVLAHAAALGLEVIAGGPCAMVESRSWPHDRQPGA